jgi:Domain of unknown function (DUF4852)
MRFLSIELCIFSAAILTLVSGCSKSTEYSAEKSTGNSGITEISSGSNGGTAIYKFEKNGQVEYGDRATIEKLAKTEQKTTAVLPVLKGDKSLPNAHYQELNSAMQLVFAYLALDVAPVNYERVAQMMSNEYGEERDEFKKRDLMASLKPAIDKGIEKAKQNRYYSIVIGDGLQLQNYDFESKSFLITALSNASIGQFFNNNRDYGLKFSNASSFKNLVVTDENLARKIEALRSQTLLSSEGLQVKILFFTTDTEVDLRKYVNAEIMRVQITDKDGKPLL